MPAPVDEIAINKSGSIKGSSEVIGDSISVMTNRACTSRILRFSDGSAEE
jgi:hypothetical protein